MEQLFKCQEIFYTNYSSFKNENLHGRYLNFHHIKPELEKLNEIFEIKNEGFSVLKNPIPSIEFGQGTIKILAWSQMHGNESTTTKAVFDLLNFLQSDADSSFSILKNCRIKIIPMLNPDGAAAYTRENANAIDLNRDAFNLHEPESRLLRQVYSEFNPHYCLNLHDQRTIFSAGEAIEPATLSFLAPAMDEERSINENRREAMQLIAGIANSLQPFLKSKIGRYDDAYNKNCTGDSFMGLGIPTILFEAGHFPNDYEREETRRYMALSIFSTLKIISEKMHVAVNYREYFKIPENEKLFYDVILRNTILNEEKVDVGIQFKEELVGNEVFFTPIVEEISVGIDKFGHQEIDCSSQKVFSKSKNPVKEKNVIHQILLKDRILSIKPR